MRLGLLLLLSAPAIGAQPPASGPDLSAGAVLTAGTRGYRKLALFTDALWSRGSLEPYAWVEFGVDRNQRSLGLGGGAWKSLPEDWSVKGGLGFTRGRYHAPTGASSSISFETALEKDLGPAVAGGELRYARGWIEGFTETVPVRRTEPSRRGRAGEGARSGDYATMVTDTVVYDEADISAYGRWRALGATWGLRLGLDLPSYTRGIVSETLSVSVPAARSWRLRGAVSAEQGRERNGYLSLGAARDFY